MTAESLWMEIEIECIAADVRVAATTSRGKVARSHLLGPDMSIERLRRFGAGVAEAARLGQPLGRLASEARAIRNAVMAEQLDALRSELHGAAGGGPVLIRFMIKSPELHSVPWEALCDPEETSGFWGISPHYLVARGVMAAKSTMTWRVPRALNVLAVSPVETGSIERVRQTLAARIDSKEVVWLDPIGPDRACASYLIDRLKQEPAPHVIQFVGHGGMRNGEPVLYLADDAAGEPTWVGAEPLGKQLDAATRGTVRLIVLEACAGASPGEFASAAEALARCGVGAVIAHLWPVTADFARRCSERFYAAFVSDPRTRGDVAAALNQVRRELFLQGQETAETFSPVLHLRSDESRLFEFSEVVTGGEGPGVPDSSVPAEFKEFMELERPFTLVLGDRWRHDRDAFEKFKEKVRVEIPRELSPPEGLPSSAVMERAVLQGGPEALDDYFQETFKQVTRPKFIDAIAHVLRPGPQITLLRTPVLEQAIEEAKPDKTLYVVQPREPRPLIHCRPAGAKAWDKLPQLPDSFDPDREFLILRLYSGYIYSGSPQEPIFTRPLMTEDDFLHLSSIADVLSGRGRDALIVKTVNAELHARRALLMGLSTLAWHHRKLLHDVFNGKQVPEGSLAIVDPGQGDHEFWRGGKGLPGKVGVTVVPGTADDLNRWLGSIAAQRQDRQQTASSRGRTP